jgi:endonuclease/exonuclease/phosphatase family metal-dependent hydrolase
MSQALSWAAKSILAVLTLMQSFAQLQASGGETIATETKTLRVITYNVQFLPAPVDSRNERKRPEYRARRIAQEVSRFDIVGLQETFHQRFRTKIIDQTRPAWNGTLHHVMSPTPDGFYTSGGCLILTRLPIRASTSTVFANYSTFQEHGFRADGFAAKGVIHARIARGPDETDNYIDVFVTHLEARADHLRQLQYRELADFVQRTSDPDHPILLLGDLNTRGTPKYRDDPQSPYSVLLRLLGEARPNGGVVDLWPRLRGTAHGGTTHQESTEIGKRIDYIMLGNPKPPGVQLKPISIDVNLFQDQEVVALSDHNAVVAELQWPAR